MPTHKVAVVIPFYKETLTEYEKISLLQCARTLAGHPFIAIKPQTLRLPTMDDLIILNDVVSFKDSYFKGIAGYNRLMLSGDFYGAFLSYEYILICQLDTFVFKDELYYWCGLDIDYIGAPWIKPAGRNKLLKGFYAHLQRYYIRYNVLAKGVPSGKQFENKVGNGGFSLRRVKVFHDLTISMPQAIDSYLEKENVHQYNEDAFWSIEVNRKEKKLKIGTLAQGLRFAFELYPERAFRLNRHRLPFGCHAWNLNLDYWRPVFKKFGYDI